MIPTLLRGGKILPLLIYLRIAKTFFCGLRGGSTPPLIVDGEIKRAGSRMNLFPRTLFYKKSLNKKTVFENFKQCVRMCDASACAKCARVAAAHSAKLRQAGLDGVGHFKKSIRKKKRVCRTSLPYVVG